MSKAVNSVVLDAAGTKIATATRVTICSAQPGSISDLTTYGLGNLSGLTSGQYTLAAGDVSGRKVTIGAITGIAITTSGTALYIALDDGTNVLIVTTCTSQALVAGQTVSIPAWKNEIEAPT